MNFDPVSRPNLSNTRFDDHSQKLLNKVSKLSKNKLIDLMGISKNLAALNHERYQNISWPHTQENAKPAIDTFRGDVYLGLQAETLSDDDRIFAQQHLRILSGLYGILRPMDLIQPYRLEMGTKLPVGRRKNLYAFWQDKLMEVLNQDILESGTPAVVNLASNEYFHAIDEKKLKAPVYTIQFKEWRGGKLRSIQFNLKRARGFMARFIIDHRIDKPELLKGFDTEGYFFDAERSDENTFLFTREVD